MPDNLDELRHIEGFPLGEDEDLIALSDPPRYTAYPNPHIAEFVEKWGKPYDEAIDNYHREPYVTDVSEGKNDPIYNAHSYHTKVPYKAIVPFIEHYTEPGDIVFDGFCGTGMTGVAAQMVGRRAVLCDLSPAATFIAYNYNSVADKNSFVQLAKKALDRLADECNWLYEISDSYGKLGIINSVVWSEVFQCPYCQAQIKYWDVATDEQRTLRKELAPCPFCGASFRKTELVRVRDEAGKGLIKPVYIDFTSAGKRYGRRVTPEDEHLLTTFEAKEIPYWYPSVKMLFLGAQWGDTWRAGYHAGYEHVSDFYFHRALWVLAALRSLATSLPDRLTAQRFLYLLTSVCFAATKLYKYRTAGGGQPAGNNLYIPSLIKEQNVLQMLRRKVKDIQTAEASKTFDGRSFCLTTNSTTALPQISDNSIDYIFVDPPFGSNIMYSESNFIWESWLKVYTSRKPEAIINQTQRKQLREYRELMWRAFAEMNRILKPGRWITVEFHNSSAAVWNTIQETISRAGFVVAQVAILDKQQRTFKQVTCPGAVKNDLVINAYKPRAGFSQRFISQAGRGLETDFVRQHLAQLPVAANVERSKEMLYSKYLAYYVQHGYQVAYNAEQFYRVLAQWGLVELDDYWFADDAQANEYEKRKAGMHDKTFAAQAVLFISDESSARQWLRHFLNTPKSYDEIYTAFVKALQTPEDKIPELITLLKEGFVRTNGDWKRPDSLTQAELEARRQERLLRQFQDYLRVAAAGRQLEEVRKEALFVGFTEAYRAGRYQDIITVGKRLDKRLLESSPDLFDFVDIAEARVER